jgi:hypothetical protein
MKALTLAVIGDEIWLVCSDHGLIQFFSSGEELATVTEAEHDHALTHLTEILEIA